VARCPARQFGDVALAGKVFDKDDLAAADVVGLALAHGDFNITRQIDDLCLIGL